MTKPATTTPDPEFNIPASGEPHRKLKAPDEPQAQAAPQSGGGGAPGTGQQEEPDASKIPPAPPGSDGLQGAKPGTIYSPGEGVTEEEAERAARDTGG